MAIEETHIWLAQAGSTDPTGMLSCHTDHRQRRNKTRMYSSGMRTARLLTISQHALHRGVCPGGVSQHAMGHTPPVDRQTPVKT